jgi:hypothetical protein
MIVAGGNRTDISVAVFARDQGHFLHGCLTSAVRAAAIAEGAGRSIELLLILQNATRQSRTWVERLVGPAWQVSCCDDDRDGMARAAAFEAARGQYFATLDGWDLWSANWLAAALDMAERTPYPAVFHPEAVIRFGNNYFSYEGYTLVFQPDAVAFDYDYTALLGSNPYPTGFFAHRSIVSAVPFPVEDPERGWSDVDWWWNCNVVGAGFHHRVVLETFHCQRVETRDQQQSAGLRLGTPKRIGPTPLSRSQSLPSR